MKKRHWLLLTSVLLNSETCALMDKMLSATLTLSLSTTPHMGDRPIVFTKDNISIPTLALPAHHLLLQKLSLEGSLHSPVKIKTSNFFAQLTIL